MNDELQKMISDLLSKPLSGVDKTIDFLTGEIPLYVQELLMWHGVYSFVEFVFGLCVLILIPVSCKAVHNGVKNKGWDDESYLELGFGLIFLVIFSVIYINLTWLQIWIAPRVFLVEYAAKLVN